MSSTWGRIACSSDGSYATKVSVAADPARRARRGPEAVLGRPRRHFGAESRGERVLVDDEEPARPLHRLAHEVVVPGGRWSAGRSPRPEHPSVELARRRPSDFWTVAPQVTMVRSRPGRATAPLPKGTVHPGPGIGSAA